MIRQWDGSEFEAEFHFNYDEAIGEILNIIKKEKEQKMKKEFTIDMLDTCHIVKFRNGHGGVIYKTKDNDLIVVYDNNGGWDYVGCVLNNTLEGYSTISKQKMNKNYDVVEVYRIPDYGFQYIRKQTLKELIKNNLVTLIWEREEKKEMTIAEIEKELGYSIKIVKE